MTTPSLKLVYFDMGGRAEATRLAFFIGGIPFDDERVEWNGFGTTLAHKYPFELLPVLEVNGQVIAESIPILRYAGRLTGLYPKNDPLGALLIDEVLELIEVFTERNLRWEREEDPTKQQILEQELTTTLIPRYFQALDAKLQVLATHPTFAMDPSAIFIHDLVLRSFVEYIIRPDWPQFVPDRSTISHVLARVQVVESHPKVQQYYALEKLRLAVDTKPLKLTDVDASFARGDPIRWALKLGGIPFEETRVASTLVDAMASRLPTLQLEDGREISQYFAILRYVGTRTGLYPGDRDPLLSCRIDELLSQLEDLQNVWYFQAFTCDDANAQRLFRHELIETKIPRLLNLLNRRLSSGPGPYAIGATLTIADLAIAGALEQLAHGTFLVVSSGDAMEPVSLTEYSTLQQLRLRVQCHVERR